MQRSRQPLVKRVDMRARPQQRVQTRRVAWSFPALLIHCGRPLSLHEAFQQGWREVSISTTVIQVQALAGVAVRSGPVEWGPALLAVAALEGRQPEVIRAI